MVVDVEKIIEHELLKYFWNLRIVLHIKFHMCRVGKKNVHCFKSTQFTSFLSCFSTKSSHFWVTRSSVIALILSDT